MSRVNVILRVPVARTWDAGTRLQVYEDRGTGTVDYTRPLLGRPVEVFPGRPANTPPLQRIAGDGRLGRRQDGSGSRDGLAGKAGTTESYVDVAVSIRAGYGLRTFGVVATSPAGVPQSAPVELEHFVSATDPRPVKRFALETFDAGSRRVRFAIE
ncbi:MAG: hypothetical protein J5J06_05635 [Phycisphaerae bacterium]|nr:hypothetical protein [Phycisphaerae bacterium]